MLLTFVKGSRRLNGSEKTGYTGRDLGKEMMILTSHRGDDKPSLVQGPVMCNSGVNNPMRSYTLISGRFAMVRMGR